MKLLLAPRATGWRRAAVAGLLAAGAAGAAPLDIPSDLRGACAPPRVAWRLAGISAGASVVAVAGDPPGRLLVGGSRPPAAKAGEVPAAPAMGDACLVSDRGWGIRRLVTGQGMQGWPAMLRRVVLAGDAAGRLHVWPLGTSERDLSPWQVDAGGPMRVGPLVVGGTFVFAGGARVQCVSDLVQPRWKTEVAGPVTQAMACDGATVFAAAGQALVALAAEDGRERWRIALPQAPQTGLLVTAGLVVLGLADGSLRAYDAGDGEEAWQVVAANAAFAPHLALGGPWLFAADQAGKLVAVEATSGEILWRAESVPPLGSPTIGYGHVFAVNGDGALVATPIAPDRPAWQYTIRDENQAIEHLTGVASVVGPRLYVTTIGGALVALDLREPTGPVPWPVPGGTSARNGRVIPPGQGE